MRAVGKMNQQIVLQGNSPVNDGGQLTDAWDDPGVTVWAEVTAPRGSEAVQAARENASETIRVRMHWRDDVKDSWRLQWQGQFYYIQHVDRSEILNGELWVTATLTGAE